MRANCEPTICQGRHSAPVSPASRAECLQEGRDRHLPSPRATATDRNPTQLRVRRRPESALSQSPPGCRWTQLPRFSIPAVLDPSVFKAYDVRGIYPTEVDEEGAYAIGRAFVEQFEPKRIAVGHDMRVTSPALAEAATDGAADAGAAVLVLGLVGTEMLSFAVGDLGLDGGIAVTASHNPKEYTGLKIVRGGALPVGGESGLLEIRDRAVAITARSETGARGRVEPYDIWPAYIDRVLSFVDLQSIKPLKVVIDAANG